VSSAIPSLSAATARVVSVGRWGLASLDAYTEVKSVWIDMGNKIEFRVGPMENSDAL
jgi:hypothetical protein